MSANFPLRVAQRMHELTAPLRDEMREIDKRLSQIEREAAELRGARRQVEKVLRQLDPGSFVAKPKKNGPVMHDEMNATKRQAVIDFLTSHREQYAEGVVAAVLYRDIRDSGMTPIPGAHKVREVVEELHGNGILRADKKVRGGAILYKFVGNGGSNGEAPS